MLIKLHHAMTKKKMSNLPSKVRLEGAKIELFFNSGNQNGRCVKKAFYLGPLHMVVRAGLGLENSESKFRYPNHLFIA